MDPRTSFFDWEFWAIAVLAVGFLLLDKYGPRARQRQSHGDLPPPHSLMETARRHWRVFLFAWSSPFVALVLGGWVLPILFLLSWGLSWGRSYPKVSTLFMTLFWSGFVPFVGMVVLSQLGRLLFGTTGL